VKGKIGLVPKPSLEAALVHWQEGQAQLEREKKSAMVEHIFKEYKSERGKEVRKGG
jgi:predicted RNase H-like nuclease (RuvC/YqgF family)